MRCLATALLVIVAGCAAPPEYLVNVVSQPSVLVAEPGTWRLDRSMCVPTGDPRLDDAVLDELMVAAIRVVLTERGLVEESQGPDVLVSYKLWVSGEGIESGGSDALRLSLRLADRRTGEFMWLAELKTRVELDASGTRGDAEGAEDGVRELFSHYPPAYLRD